VRKSAIADLRWFETHASRAPHHEADPGSVIGAVI
jgi:hypothetical protein